MSSSSLLVTPLSSPSAPSSLFRLTSLTRLHAELPLHLQPSFDQLASLHTSLDLALSSLDSATSIAQITAQTSHIKSLIAQLQQRLASLQSLITADPSPPSLSSSPTPSTDRDLAYAASLLSQHSTLAASYTTQLRQRILSSRAHLAQRSADIRKQLLTSSSNPHPSSSSSSLTSSSTLREADRHTEFTASLHATHELLSSSLALSSASLHSLSSSTSTLRDIQRQSVAYKGVVKGGSQVITKQMQRARTDRWLIIVGLVFFSLVCLYIVDKRLRISKIIGFVMRMLMPAWGGRGGMEDWMKGRGAGTGTARDEAGGGQGAHEEL